MNINILAFGIAKEIAESSFMEIECHHAITVMDLKTLIEKKYPALKMIGSFMIAVNNQYAGDEIIINAGDEVAVIPPVSGG